MHVCTNPVDRLGISPRYVYQFRTYYRANMQSILTPRLGNMKASLSYFSRSTSLINGSDDLGRLF